MNLFKKKVDLEELSEYRKVIQKTMEFTELSNYCIKYVKQHISRVAEYGHILGYDFESHDIDKLETTLFPFFVLINAFYTRGRKWESKKEKLICEEVIKLHRNENSHHPEYFVNPWSKSKETIYMLQNDIIEMVCDWTAVSDVVHDPDWGEKWISPKNNPVYSFYMRNKSRWNFSDYTREVVQDSIAKICEIKVK